MLILFVVEFRMIGHSDIILSKIGGLHDKIASSTGRNHLKSSLVGMKLLDYSVRSIQIHLVYQANQFHQATWRKGRVHCRHSWKCWIHGFFDSWIPTDHGSVRLDYLLSLCTPQKQSKRVIIICSLAQSIQWDDNDWSVNQIIATIEMRRQQQVYLTIAPHRLSFHFRNFHIRSVTSTMQASPVWVLWIAAFAHHVLHLEFEKWRKIEVTRSLRNLTSIANGFSAITKHNSFMVVVSNAWMFSFDWLSIFMGITSLDCWDSSTAGCSRIENKSSSLPS